MILHIPDEIVAVVDEVLLFCGKVQQVLLNVRAFVLNVGKKQGISGVIC